MKSIIRVINIFIFVVLLIGLISCADNEPNVNTTDLNNTNVNRTNSIYNIIFKNHDDTVLSSENFVYGEMPVYRGNVPTKKSTAEYDYVFNGWNPELKKVTENKTYYAIFKAEKRENIISINNYNWGSYFSFKIKLNNVNSNSYTNYIAEKLTITYTPLFTNKYSVNASNITVMGYVNVKIGYTTNNYKNINFMEYKVYFTNYLYKDNNYYGSYIVSLYKGLNSSYMSTASWVTNVDVYLTNVFGDISI